MSRGPGKWQRRILGALAIEDWCIVNDLLPEGAKRAEYSAINRAAHLLANEGKIGIANRLTPIPSPRDRNVYRPVLVNKMVAHRIGFFPPIYSTWEHRWMNREEFQAQFSHLWKKTS